MNEQKDDAVAEAARLLNGLYVCTRDESAWDYGTMTLDDFQPAWQDEDVVNDFASLSAQPTISAEQAEAIVRIVMDTECEHSGSCEVGSGDMCRSPENGWQLRRKIARRIRAAGLTVGGDQK